MDSNPSWRENLAKNENVATRLWTDDRCGECPGIHPLNSVNIIDSPKSLWHEGQRPKVLDPEALRIDPYTVMHTTPRSLLGTCSWPLAELSEKRQLPRWGMGKLRDVLYFSQWAEKLYSAHIFNSKYVRRCQADTAGLAGVLFLILIDSFRLSAQDDPIAIVEVPVRKSGELDRVRGRLAEGRRSRCVVCENRLSLLR